MCGSTDTLTDEHVISKTVRKQLPLLSLVRRIYQGRRSGGRQVLHVVLTKAVCKQCNGGWMAQLETDFVDLLGPQLRNEGAVRLNPSSAERVATWAVKTGLLLQLYSIALGGNNAWVSENNLRWLKDHVSPPPGAEVWMGRYNAENKQLHWSRPGCLIGKDGNPISFINAFTVGYVVFYVFGSDEVVAGLPGFNLAALKPPPWFSEMVVQLWPGDGNDAVWPHRQSLRFDQLDRFAMWPMATVPPTPEGDQAPT